MPQHHFAQEKVLHSLNFTSFPKRVGVAPYPRENLVKTTYCEVFQLLMETGIDLLTRIFHHADEPHQDWKNTILGVLHQVHNHKDKYESKL